MTDLYIESNKVALQEDISRGQGEALASLLTIWNCENTQNIGSALQNNYNGIFSSTATTESIKNAMKNTIKNNQSVSASCQTLI